MNRRTIMLIFIAILVIALLIGMVIGNGKENDLRGGGCVLRHEQGGTADLRHRPLRIRCRHPQPGICPGQESGTSHRSSRELLP